MYFADEITFETENTRQNADGYLEKLPPTLRTVWANAKSVSRTEFYKASAIGIETSIAFVVRAEDYGDETNLLFNGNRYTVVRAYRKDSGDVELTCKNSGAGHG